MTPEVVDNRGAICLTINTGEAMLSAEASDGAVVSQPGDYETVAASERPSADAPSAIMLQRDVERLAAEAAGEPAVRIMRSPEPTTIQPNEIACHAPG